MVDALLFGSKPVSKTDKAALDRLAASNGLRFGVGRVPRDWDSTLAASH